MNKITNMPLGDAGAAIWGSITGNIESQTDLSNSLALKQVANPGISCTTPISANDIILDYTARTLTIVPPLGYFDIIIDGNGSATRYRKTGNQVFTWTDTTGSWYFYYNSSGVAVNSQTGWDDFETQVAVYKIEWDSTKSPDAAKSISEGYEAHCSSVSGSDHIWKHAYKSIWISGLDSIDNALASGTPNASGLNTCVGLTSGKIMDDNLLISITNGSGSAKFEQNMGIVTAASLTISNGGLFTIATTAGANGLNLPSTRFPFDWNSSTNIPNYITANGTRIPVTNLYYFVYFLFAYQDPRNGQSVRLISAPVQFSNLNDADAYNWDTLIGIFTGLGLSNEVRPLYKYTFEYKSNFDAAIKYTALRKKSDLRRNIVQVTNSTGSTVATSVVVTPYGNISSTNAQSALQELDDEKLSIGGDTKASKIIIGTKDNYSFAFKSNNSEVVNILGTGLVGINTANPLTKLTVLDTLTSSPRGILSLQINDGADGARIGFAKARGTEAVKTTVQTGDMLGRIMFRGYDGTNFLEMASIDVGVSGTVGTNRIPTYLTLSTATDVSPSVLTERVRILNNGNVGIGTPTPSFPLHVYGSYSKSGAFTNDVPFGITSTNTAAVDIGGTILLAGKTGNSVSELKMGIIRAAKESATTNSYASYLAFHTVAGLGTSETNAGDYERLRITSTGLVGIGTLAPTKNLSLSGQTAQTLGLERHLTADGVNFTITGGGAASGSTDKNAGMVSIGPGLSTGIGLGSFRLQGLTRAASTGTTDNALVDRVIIPSRKYLVDGGNTALFDVTLGSNQTTGGMASYTIHCTNGTEYQAHTGLLTWVAVSKGAAITANVGHSSVVGGLEIDADSSGTLTDTPTCTAGTGKVTIGMTVDSSLTGTPVICIEYVFINQGSTAVTQL